MHTGMPLWYENHWQALLLVQALLGVFAFSYALRHRPRFWLRLGMSLVLGAALVEAVTRLFFDRGLWAEFLVITILYILLNGIVFFCYDESPWTVLFVTASGYLVQDMASALKSTLRFSLPTNFFDELASTTPGVLLFDVVCYGGFYLLAWLIFHSYIQNGGQRFGTRGKALFSVAALLLCAGLTRMTRDGADHSFTLSLSLYLYRTLCDAFVLIIQYSVMERALLSERMETMRQIVHQQHRQYRASRERVWQLNEKYHDLKQLLTSLRGKVPASEVEKLEKSISAYTDAVRTGNNVLDVVLSEKSAQCRRHGIQLTCYADGAALDFVEGLDLYSLMDDALSNAIEETMKLSLERRFVTVTVRREGGMTAIHVENPCGLARSADLDRGYGLHSMQHIAAKYGGSMAIKQQKEMFYLDVLLLAPESSSG